MGGPYLIDYKLELQPVVRILRIAIARWKGTPYSYRVLVFREYFGFISKFRQREQVPQVSREGRLSERVVGANFACR